MVTPGTSFEQTTKGWSPRCHIPSFVKISPPFLEKKIFEGFYHIWAWRPSWSCDPDAANKISFPLPKKAPHKIWLRSAQRFWKRRSLSIVNDGRRRRRTDGGSNETVFMWLRFRILDTYVAICLCVA